MLRKFVLWWFFFFRQFYFKFLVFFSKSSSVRLCNCLWPEFIMDFLIVVFVVLFNSDIIYISEWEKKMLVGMLVSLVLVDCFHIMHSIDTLYGRTTFSSNFKYKNSKPNKLQVSMWSWKSTNHIQFQWYIKWCWKKRTQRK